MSSTRLSVNAVTAATLIWKQALEIANTLLPVPDLTVVLLYDKHSEDIWLALLDHMKIGATITATGVQFATDFGRFSKKILFNVRISDTIIELKKFGVLDD